MMGKTIGTHNGRFHVDEVLGCYMLKQLPQYKNAKIIRSRDPAILDSCDIVIDVGADYSHREKRYDHHQKGFFQTLETITGIKQTMKLSSAGLVYAHYGKEVIRSLLPNQLTKEEMKLIYTEVYIAFVKEIDAKDNGIDPCDHVLRYRVNTDIASRVQRLNPNIFRTDWTEDGQFEVAMEMVGREFKEVVLDLVHIWLPCRKWVSEAIDKRFEVDKSGQIVEIPHRGVPWTTHLKQIEKELQIVPEILFVIYPDNTSGWRVQAIPKADGFELRKRILRLSNGMRDEPLVMLCRIEDATFVHSNGFIGGAKSREGVLQMAKKSLLENYNF